MNLFVRKHEKKINAARGCFDRMLFRGYLPIQSGWAMAQLLKQKDIRCPNLKDFLSENAGRVNDHAKTMATKLGRPFQYLTAPTRKEDLARKMAAKEGIGHGLVCVFSVLEPCRSFSFKFKTGFPYVQSAGRKCLFLHFYFMDRDFGLIHVKLQAWFPMQIQVYINHNTLCFGAKEVMSFLGRKLTGHFGGEIISDMNARCQRIPGARIKHRVKENWLKMCDKAGSVLRVEMVINMPEEYCVSSPI